MYWPLKLYRSFNFSHDYVFFIFFLKKKEKSVEFASSVFGLGSAFANRSNNGPASGPSGPRAAVTEQG